MAEQLHEAWHAFGKDGVVSRRLTRSVEYGTTSTCTLWDQSKVAVVAVELLLPERN